MIADLQIDERGYPIPWFVAYVDGIPDFRVADGDKIDIALNERRCWICGKALGLTGTFVGLAPIADFMLAPEPPCHEECAEYAVKHCPYLALPKSTRRTKGLVETVAHKHKITDVVALVKATEWHKRKDGLVQIDRPTKIRYFRAGAIVS